MAIKPLNSVAGFSVGEYPYITVVQSNGDINTSNITTTGVANLNSISNVKITGGASGQVITTDGTGNLSFVAISTSGLTNGTSNINVLNNGNIEFSSAGNANVLVITGSGANITGTINASGNANFGNVGAIGGYFTTVSGNLTTAAQPNITSVGTLTSLDVLGNVTAANITANTGIFSGNAAGLTNIPGGNVTGTVANANYAAFAGVVTSSAQPNITSVGNLSSLTVTGNIGAGGLLTDNLYYANGSQWDFAQPAGSNTQVQYNDGAGGFGASANFTFNEATQVLNVTGNVTATNIYANSGIIGAQTLKGEGGNISNIQGANVSGTVASASSATTAGTVTTNAQPNITSVGTLTSLSVTGNISGGNVAGGNLISANYVLGTLTTAAQPNITSVGTLSSLDVSGNVTAANITANTGIFSGNAAGLTNIPGGNVTGTVSSATNAAAVLTQTSTNTTVYLAGTSSSANGNVALEKVTGIYANMSNNAITATTFVGTLSGAATTAGTVTTNAQPNITSVGVLNELTVANTILADGYSARTGSDLTISVLGQNANVIIAPLGTGITNFSGKPISNISSANITGNANVGNLGTTQVVATGNITTSANLVSDYLVARTDNLNLVAAAGNYSVVLTPSGTGTIDGSGSRLANIATPAQASDAATKYYVDNALSAGITFHTSVTVETPTALTATYANGGTTPTITDISGGNLLTTSTNHGLSVGDVIVFDTTSNGLTAGVAYFVYTTPALNTLTLSSTYSGTPVTGLTNGTGLTLSSKANTGVGATLTNSGTQAALQIDGVNLSVGNRVLVYKQTNSYENGIYSVTNAGSGSTNWVLTRATDANKYIPNSSTGMSEGDYFYVQQGLTGAGESYVNNTNGVIIFGTTNITFAQFSDTQIYTAGTGLTLTGTQFSISNTAVTAGSYGNGDSVATFTVNNQGQLTAASNTVITANAANLTGTTLASTIVNSSLTSVGSLVSLTVTGTASAGNLSTGGTLSVTGNANVGNLGTSGLIVATGNITGGNISTGGTLSVTGNANVGNIGATNGVFTNVSGNGSSLSSITGANVTGQVGNALIAGTVYTNAQPNITSVGTLSSLSVTGNITGGNLVGTLANGTSNIAIPTSSGNVNITSGGTTTLVITSTGANITGTLNTGTGNASFGNVTATNGNLSTANVSGSVILGNSTVTTAVSWSSVTTTSTTANQTIASFAVSEITGVEFLVKGVDSTGSKYSVATVQAVTDGTNLDYTTYGGVTLGGYTGTLSAAVVGGFLRLQITPSSSNSTVWTTQYRFI